MASDVMAVRLHLPQIRVPAVVADTPEELRVRVESTVRRPTSTRRASACRTTGRPRFLPTRSARSDISARSRGRAVLRVRSSTPWSRRRSCDVYE